MKIINEKTGVAYHAYTKSVTDRHIAAFVDRITKGVSVRVSYAEFNTYALPRTRVHGQAYRSACACCRALARNHAYLN